MSDRASRMHRWTIMCLLLGLWVAISSGCTKDNRSTLPPTIQFLHDSGYVSVDTSLIVGDHVTIGIEAQSSEANITFFQVSVNNGTRSILLDSGLNASSLRYNLTVIKSASAYEKWTFLVMDRNRNLDSIQILLQKSDSSHYGKIKVYSQIELGAQENGTFGSFFSLHSGQVYSLAGAYQNQSLIDVIYYYGMYEGTLSSPNESEAPSIFSGEMGIANWSIKNETRYDTTLLTPIAFDKAQDDSLLLAVYEPTAGKRKGKFVLPGMVFSFKNYEGKIGLLKVEEVVPGTMGKMRCSIKVQE